MNTCVLRPPNNRELSDEVIGDVAQRARQAERYAVSGVETQATSPFLGQRGPMQANYQYAAEGRPQLTPEGVSKVSTFGPISPMDGNRKRAEAPSGMSSDDTTPLKRRHYHQHQDVIKEIVSEQDRLRELRRLRQIRYRKKKEDYANSLDVENKQLQEEIDALEQRRRSFAAAVPAKESVWSVAAEYFRLFRYGFQPTASSAMKPSTQQDFLVHSMTTDVVYNTGSGPGAMAKSWKCLSLWFKDVEFELEGLQKGPKGSLVATTTTSVTITERTLRNVFPHLSRDSSLGMKLAEQRVVMRGSLRFEWDPESGRVCRVMAQSDMMTPMLRLLGSLGDVSKVFERSLISPDFQWRSNA